MIQKTLYVVGLVLLLFGSGRGIYVKEKTGKTHKNGKFHTYRKRPSLLASDYPSLKNQTRGEVKMDDAKTSANPVVVFTAWHSFKNVTHYKPRIDHHVAYTKRHGYKYVIFVAVDITADQKTILGNDVQVILVPGFVDRRDMQSVRKPLSTGWLKIEGFKILFKDISAPALFFYLDMDVIFHNFNVPLSRVFEGKPQSIFVQDAGRMFAPSHAVPIRHTPEALRFIEDWASLMPGCPNLNMEQGAYMTAIARFLNDCSGNSEDRCRTGCEHMCTSSKFRDRRNSKFYECSSKVLEQLNEARSIYTRQDIFIYRRVPQYHRAPKDGFTLNLVAAYNTTGSCPLTVHPDKNYEQRVIPSLHDCADVPMVYVEPKVKLAQPPFLHQKKAHLLTKQRASS